MESYVAGQKGLRAWLEGEILDGRLAPGERVDEQQVCARFGVSRTPVREALLQLASLDLIEFRPRYGAIIRQMSVKEIAAIWEVLTCLEGLAAGLAARRMTMEDRAALERIHADARGFMEAGEVAGYDDRNKLFHEAIYRGCRNDYLANQAMTIRRRLQSYRRYPFHRAGGLQRSFAGHQQVLDAIIAGDDEKAAAAMRDHVAGGLSFLDLVAELPAHRNASHETAKEGEPRAAEPVKRRGARPAAPPRPVDTRTAAGGKRAPGPARQKAK
jgi:DNA-binding GntR family transcriptional regulator